MSVSSSYLFVLLLVCLSVSVRTLLIDRLMAAHRPMSGGHKRAHSLDAGNPCPDAEKPFPCKSTRTCIPMGYLCDDNVDCEDGYDEDREVCTAAHRPPVEDILTFVESERGWMISNLFGGKNIRQVAHGLAVSPTVEDFSLRLGLSPEQTLRMRAALDAVRLGDETTLVRLGMPTSAWSEVSFFFSKLIKSGFLNP